VRKRAIIKTEYQGDIVCAMIRKCKGRQGDYLCGGGRSLQNIVRKRAKGEIEENTS
jgi:hypothetical protein